ncbi:MAG: DUF2090 domain-containing protein [Burkholderiaceae bacterium]|nr:DUF2090 domain-containing protein [Burkholderiaceae bacterium]
MSVGYIEPLYLLPFDHRNSYVTGMFDYELPLTAQQHQTVADSKRVIYEGFRQALQCDVPGESAGILVDEEFGAEILRDAAGHGYVTALSTEKSGSDEFEFEYGDAFAEHIEAFDPTFAKVLVRYNPEGDVESNRRQSCRLKQLCDVCRRTNRRFMFELLVPATKAQLNGVQSDQHQYDLKVRPELMLQSIRALQDAGVEPDIWKIEGLDQREDCERVVEVARRDGRREVACIVLGRGADQKKVVSWLETAAKVAGFTGFAVGRTTFWDAVKDFTAGTITRPDAVTRIAERFRRWVEIFEEARAARGRAA